jgi:LemA protein
MNIGILLLGAAVAAGFYVIATYNSLVTIKTRIKASIQEIGNQLKRQMDLIPNLEESVKGYLKHEKTIFSQLTEARKAVAMAVKSGTMGQAQKAAEMLSKLVPALSVIVEDNPQLKADTTVTRLMEELRDTADKVMYARRTLIDLAADFNRMVVAFPSNLVGKLFGFKTEAGLETAVAGEHLTVTEGEMKSPKISL